MPWPKEIEFQLSPNYEHALLDAVARACDDAIISTDLDGIVSTWNESAARIFGRTAGEMIGQSFLEVVPERSREFELEILHTLPAGARTRYEAARLKGNGDTVQVLASVTPIVDDNGIQLGVSRIERELSSVPNTVEDRARLAAIVESSDDAIVGKNLQGIITSWNQAATRMFGHTADEIIGKSILTIIPPELHPEEAEILRKIRAGERIDHYRTRRVTKDGQSIEVSLTISPIKDAEGRVIGSSKIARDISRQLAMERLLIQSEKLAATGRMAATIAHEVNNPLDAVMNLVYLAKKSVARNGKALPYLLTAEKELDRVAHIARQTLGFYRDPGVPRRVSVEQLIHDVLAVYRSKLVASNITTEFDFADHRQITGSSGELMQVFSNIITNAIDAMPYGGVLSIATREAGGAGVEILFGDNGTGIEAQNLEKVFEPFFTTKGSVGTGIGLWVARQLIERHGGTIRIQSSTKSAEQGTTVTVSLPFKT